MHEAALFDPEGAVADATLCGVGDGCGEGTADDGGRPTGKGSDERDNFGSVPIDLGKVDKCYLRLEMVGGVCGGFHVVRVDNA